MAPTEATGNAYRSERTFQGIQVLGKQTLLTRGSPSRVGRYLDFIRLCVPD